MLVVTDFLFYFLALFSFICAAGVILAQNPVHSALFLVVTMVSIAGIFVTLDALFVAGVQLIVYAGAVMVLFVMVLMLFDLKHEMKTFSKGLFTNGLKLVSVGLLLGLITGSIWLTADGYFQQPVETAAQAGDTTKILAEALFTRYIFAFEAIGVLLLIIAIGAVSLSRIVGGTHAD